MNWRLWRIVGAAVLVVALVAVVALAVVYSGIAYVGADRPAPAIVDWFLGTASDRSVARHARGIRAPSLDEPARIERGALEYSETCVVCHGAPSVAPSDLSRGLSPSAPDLAEADKELSPAELFWVTKHGIRMTGMPAWGRTHSDDDLWDVVAFVERLPRLTPVQYGALTRGRGERRGSAPAVPAEHGR